MQGIPNLEIKTSHSLGYEALRNEIFDALRLDNSKYYKIMKDVVIRAEKIESKTFKEQNKVIFKDLEYFFQLYKKAMYYKYFAFYHDDPDFIEQFESMKEKFIFQYVQAKGKKEKLKPNEIQTLENEMRETLDNNQEKYIAYIQKTLQIGVETHSTIDYTDMLYLANREDKILFNYDYVFVDECQDLNTLQIKLLKKIKAKKFIFVGDPCQAIYGFAGALNNSFNRLQEEFECKNMPLSETFRCPKNVIDFVRANYTKSDITTSKKTITPIKQVKYIAPETLSEGLVLCSCNAPLLDLFVDLVRIDQPCRINKSKEFFDEFFSFIKTQFFMKKMNEWTISKVFSAKIEKAENGDEIDKLADTKSVILKFLELTGECTKDEYISKIKEILTLQYKNSKNSTLILSTVHRAKGLEADNVVILDFAKLQYFASIGSGQSDNLLYVALTRTKDKLILVD